MAKWIFALLVFASAGAQADALSQNTSGCVVLNEIIYQDVTSSGWGMTGADLVTTNFREPRAVICNGITQSSSAAHSKTAPMTVSADLRQPRLGQRGGSGRAGDLSKHRP